MRHLIFCILILLVSVTVAKAQFQKAEVKIYGLTCSICSRSVEMALNKIPYIEEINTELETTVTTILFKDEADVIPEEIADAVEKAGFSVGYMKMSYKFNSSFSQCHEGENVALTFIGDQKETKAGVYELLLVEKDLMSKKIFKDYKDAIPEACKTTKKHYYVTLADQLLLN